MLELVGALPQYLRDVFRASPRLALDVLFAICLLVPLTGLVWILLADRRQRGERSGRSR
jgi:hypothetical protein